MYVSIQWSLYTFDRHQSTCRSALCLQQKACLENVFVLTEIFEHACVFNTTLPTVARVYVYRSYMYMFHVSVCAQTYLTTTSASTLAVLSMSVAICMYSTAQCHVEYVNSVAASSLFMTKETSTRAHRTSGDCSDSLRFSSLTTPSNSVKVLRCASSFGCILSILRCNS